MKCTIIINETTKIMEMISELILQYKVTNAISLELFCDPGKFTRYIELIFFYKIFGTRCSSNSMLDIYNDSCELLAWQP
jgi:hypothetical protein